MVRKDALDQGDRVLSPRYLINPCSAMTLTMVPIKALTRRASEPITSVSEEADQTNLSLLASYRLVSITAYSSSAR